MYDREQRRNFQSPSLRGSGRFSLRPEHPPSSERNFQSPSLRGSGRFEEEREAEAREAKFSIPFIAGQWSLPRSRSDRVEVRRRFQSPSLRGSGRFKKKIEKVESDAEVFNPLHCGAVVASSAHRGGGPGPKQGFQSPSLRGSGRFGPRPIQMDRAGWIFNPLHCGAVVASRRRGCRVACHYRFSIPFIAGQWSLPPGSGGPR